CGHHFFFQAEHSIRSLIVTGVQTCALPIFYTVATHSQSSHQHAILVKRQAAGKEDHSILIGIRRLRTLGTGVSYIERKQVEKWRSEERRVGKQCIYRCSAIQYTNKKDFVAR